MTNIYWNLEEKSYIKDMDKFQKAMPSTKCNFLQLLFDRDSLREIVELLYGEYLNDEEEIFNITMELLTTKYSLKSTQYALQDFKMEIEQLQEKFQRSHLPSYTPFSHIHKADCILEHMEESHEMVDHEMHLVLHVLENCVDKPDQNQALDLFHRKLELFSKESLFSMEEAHEFTSIGSAIEEEEAAISWVDKYCRYIIHSSTHTSISTS